MKSNSVMYNVVCTNNSKTVAICNIYDSSCYDSIIYRHSEPHGRLGFIATLLDACIVDHKIRPVEAIEVEAFPNYEDKMTSESWDRIANILLPRVYEKSMEAFVTAKEIDDETYCDDKEVIDVKKWLTLDGRIPRKYSDIFSWSLRDDVDVDALLFKMVYKPSNSRPEIHAAVLYDIANGHIQTSLQPIQLFETLPKRSAYCGLLPGSTTIEELKYEIQKKIYVLENGDKARIKSIESLSI